MSSNIDQFYLLVAKNPAMASALTANVPTQDELIARAVAMGKENGLAFSQEEARAWLEVQATAERSGELSDVQLEAVAGGKGGLTSQQTGAVAGAVIGGVLAAPLGPVGVVGGASGGALVGGIIGNAIG